jgi:hypothetical protein
MWWISLLGLWALCFAYTIYVHRQERRSFEWRDMLTRAGLALVLPCLVLAVALYAAWAFRPRWLGNQGASFPEGEK